MKSRTPPPEVDPRATTPGGLPYPLASDPVSGGAAAIQALAEAIEPRLFPIDYVERTADVLLASTVAATPTDVVVGTSKTYPAGDYWVELYCESMENASGGNGHSILDVWDGTTRLQQVSKSFLQNTSSVPVFLRSKLTLTAGAHQLKIRGYYITNPHTFRAGTGGPGLVAAMYMRVVRA